MKICLAIDDRKSKIGRLLAGQNKTEACQQIVFYVIRSCCCQPPRSDRVVWCILCGRGCGYIDFVLAGDLFVGNGVERVACNIYKTKLLLHAS